MRTLPECLLTYDIEQAGGAVKLTVSEAHQWDVPDDLLPALEALAAGR